MVFLEQGFGDDIDLLVRALRREDRGNQELKRVAVIQFAVRVRIGFFQSLDDRRHAVTFGLK